MGEIIKRCELLGCLFICMGMVGYDDGLLVCELCIVLRYIGDMCLLGVGVEKDGVCIWFLFFILEWDGIFGSVLGWFRIRVGCLCMFLFRDIVFCWWFNLVFCCVSLLLLFILRFFVCI